MTLLIQFDRGEGLALGLLDGDEVRPLDVEGGLYALAQRAVADGKPLADLVRGGAGKTSLSYSQLEADRGLLPPILHPDPARLIASGTGLTHMGSASGRDAMHKQAAQGETDSARMFRLGLEDGWPAAGEVGAAPEWFYKGDGQSLVAPGGALNLPDYAADGGEEPEIAVIYLIDDQGTPRRIGSALANEYSDHVIEKGNYLWLAHSKLRQFSIGPAIRLGDLPQEVDGRCAIHRDGAVAWEKPFESGEARMCHSLENIEYHHFKYPAFRRPGDVHVHFLGTATLSFADGFRTQPGDRFEISADEYGPALRNTLTASASGYRPGAVRSL
ncbi:MAG: GguC family protein [Erythrobacter sp.]|uniref:AraD1 family protein n=1 Tax=Erythrobacter sp. TaxID=1042 RepID=UPI002623373C|nr:AraD1 family protein [Erythrobacter sp.]MDJ0978155.1 GguC family protein [Erythrobacter sp.]